MRTNTRVEFGLYDVTARGDSVPSSTDTRGFCDLSSDLLLDKIPALPLYGTLETRQFLMDGSYSRIAHPGSSGDYGAASSPMKAAALPRRLCCKSASRRPTAAAA